MSVVILVTYPYILRLAGVEMATPVVTQEPAGNTPEGPLPEAARETAPPASTPAPAAMPTETAAVADTPATIRNVPAPPPERVREIPVETDLFHATLSTRGGVITLWQLKRFLDDDRTTPVSLFTPPAAGGTRYPLSITVNGSPGFENVVFQADRYTVNVSGEEQQTLRLSGTHPDTGVTLIKEITFHGDSYAMELNVLTRNLTDDYTLSLGSNFGIRTWLKNTIGFVGTSNLVDEDVTREDPDDMASPLARQGNIRWTVSQDKYFIAGLIPHTPVKAVISQSFGDEHVVTALSTEGGKPTEYTLYVGPKEYKLLKGLNVNMHENIDFGWFMFGTWSLVRLLAEPMFVMLTMINGFVPNWGLSIILLTLLIKTVFIPLTHKSYKSMKAMQVIQPQVKAIQTKYKDNKEKLGQETMALYREHNVNPLGGCLPIFIQIPFFIAFFNILYTAIELRQEPFMGWVVDLSSKDPYYVLPVIMGISMFVQQKIQPTAMDPKQARIMMFLPVLFTFFFMQFPAGLVLYWLFNNLFTIAQQFITVRFLTKKPATT